MNKNEWEAAAQGIAGVKIQVQKLKRLRRKAK